MLNTPAVADPSDTGPSVPTLSPTPVPVGVHDHAAQREWEQWQTTRGRERYRASLDRTKKDGTVVRKSLADLEPGQVIAQELIGPLVVSVTAAQIEAAQRVTTSDKTAAHDWAMCLVPAETLAVVTVLKALTVDAPSSFTGVCRALGGRVQDEFDLMQWKAREAAAAKEAKATGREPIVNLYRLMQHRNDVVDKRVFDKWSKKAPLFTAGDWDVSTRCALGMVLLSLLVESNGWFEAVIVRENNRTKRIFQMTEAGLSWVADRHNVNELSRPYLLPMICEPRDHCYPEVAQHCHVADNES